jgi:hypothetical protein
MRYFPLLILLGGAMLLGGCASAVSSGHNTALDSMDLVQMTDQMARSLSGNGRIADVIAKGGQLTIVVQPVENRLTGEVLPPGQAEAFVARVRTLLSKHAPDRFAWCMNRDDFYKMRGREIDLGPDPDRVQPEYALTARFMSITDESSKGRSAAYLCSYSLTSLKTSDVLWMDKYEVKKTAVKGFLD